MTNRINPGWYPFSEQIHRYWFDHVYADLPDWLQRALRRGMGSFEERGIGISHLIRLVGSK